MDLPDFIKESVPQIQILCTIQARNVGKLYLTRNPRCCSTFLARNTRARERTRTCAARRAALANATLDFVESVVVLLTVVKSEDGAQKRWLKNLNPKIASDLLGILGNSASCNRGVADGNHGGT